MSSLKKYKKIKYLGKGSYGAAILVELRSNPAQKFVIKEIIIGHLKPAEQVSARQEAEVLNQMKHSNITMYVESFVESSKLYIVMEHADGGDISESIKRRKANGNLYPETEAMRIFVQICLAMKHVHEANILHRDLKSQNIFLTSKGVVKLGDFGIAKVLDASDDQARTQIGTPYYLSPEICESKPYGRQSDVWSLGVVLYELLALELPFQAQSLPALVHRIVTAEPQYSKIEAKYSASLISLVKLLLSKDPAKRPTLKQIVMGDYIKGHICRLLSHTLKTGNVGGDGDNKSKSLIGKNGLPIGPTIEENAIDPEEADRNIEKAREKQREMEKERKEAQAQIERNAQRQEEREKWRKFRQDVKQSSNKSCVDNNLDVVVSPVLNNPNPRSNDNNHQYQHVQDQQISRNRANSFEEQNFDNNSRRGSGDEHKNGGEDIRARMRKYSSESRLETRDQQLQDNRIAAGRPSNIRNPQSLLEIQAERMRAGFPPTSSVYNQVKNEVQNNQQNHMIVQKRGKADEENFARREFFANRAAALASKNKVEALERGVYINSSRRNDVQDNDNRSNEQDNNRRRDNYDDNPENRIAMIKAQRDKDKDKELAEREKELQKAYEMNRLERKRLDELRSKPAMAFQIDLSGDDVIAGPIIQKSSEESKFNENRIRFQNEIQNRDKISNKNVLANDNNNNNNNNKEKNINNNNKQQPVDLMRETANISELQTLLPRQRKMWGPPPPLEELKLATGVVSIDLNNDCNNDNIMESPLSSPLNDEPDNETDKETRKQQDKAVLKRIEQQHDRQKESREQAKEIFRKLREQRSMKGSKKVIKSQDGKTSISPMQARLNDVMNQVNKAKEYVSINNSVTKSPIRTKNINKDAKINDTDSKNDYQVDINDKKDIEKNLIVDDKVINNNNKKKNNDLLAEIEEVNQLGNDEDDSDLEQTLNTWLTSQKKGEIKKNIAAAEAKDKNLLNSSYYDSKKINSEIEEEESVILLKTSLNKEFKDISIDDNGSSEIEEDNDVMELQMFLAKALLEEDVGEEEEIVEEINK